MYPIRDGTYQKVTPWFRDEVHNVVACSENFRVMENAEKRSKYPYLHGKAEKLTRGC